MYTGPLNRSQNSYPPRVVSYRRATSSAFHSFFLVIPASVSFSSRVHRSARRPRALSATIRAHRVREKSGVRPANDQKVQDICARIAAEFDPTSVHVLSLERLVISTFPSDTEVEMVAVGATAHRSRLRSRCTWTNRVSRLRTSPRSRICFPLTI